jgi:predicted  nucleic acid-binding Zn-ribbon protein
MVYQQNFIFQIEHSITDLLKGRQTYCHEGVDRAGSDGRRCWTMAGRMTGQTKHAQRRAKAETAPARAAAGAARKSAPARKAVAKAPAKKSAGVKKAAARKKSATAKTTRAGAKRAQRAKKTETEVQFLAEQNAALKAELEQARARIADLEALNRDVINRIDWVIDSLQTVVEDKR